VFVWSLKQLSLKLGIVSLLVIHLVADFCLVQLLNIMAYKVGVLGSGEVGKTLAKGCRDHGYQTCIASRTREKLKEFAQAENIEFGTMKEAAADSDIIILAVAGIGVVDLVTSLKDTLKNKIVIDACNPIEGAPIDGVVQFFQLPGGLSLMEHLQNLAPGRERVSGSIF